MAIHSNSSSCFIGFPISLFLDPPIKLFLFEPIRGLVSTNVWLNLQNEAVNGYWAKKINLMLKLYTSLKYLHKDEYIPGRVHPLFSLKYTSRGAARLVTMLRLATWTYILQTTRKNFNQHQVDGTCLLCNTMEESVEHFVLRCPSLGSVRDLIMTDIITELHSTVNFNISCASDQVMVQYIINCWPIVKNQIRQPDQLLNLERQCNRLLFGLDSARIRMLSQLAPRRK